MGSKGRIPPPHLRRSLPGPGMGSHPDAFGPLPPVRPRPGVFPPYDMLPPHEVMEQKLNAQQVEMQRVATENQRLAATHGTLRHELAASQHELQMLNAHIGALKSDADQQMRGMTDKITKMEAELKAAEPLKAELHKAHMEAQKLVASKQELIAKGQILSADLQRAHVDVQQIPALMSELDSLRQEYQHCRATFDYEKKLYNDHLESLQVMEKNYMNMAREVEKLRGELMNPAYADRRPVAPYGAAPGGNTNLASGHGHAASQNPYEDGYSALQGRGPPPPPTASSAVAGGTSTYVGAQSGSAPAKPGIDQAAVGAGTYDLLLHGQGGYAPNYDPQRVGYDPQRGQGYEAQRGVPGYEPSRADAGYDPQSRSAAVTQSHAMPTSLAPYGSATTTPPQPARGMNNPVRR